MSPTSSIPATARTPADVSPGRSAPRDRLTVGLAIANLIAQIGIIVTGGAVRLTGSGLGCSQWPMCEPGTFTPQFHGEMASHSVIEFGNRMLGVVVGLIAVALLWAVHRRQPTHPSPPATKRLAWLGP